MSWYLKAVASLGHLGFNRWHSSLSFPRNTGSAAWADALICCLTLCCSPVGWRLWNIPLTTTLLPSSICTPALQGSWPQDITELFHFHHENNSGFSSMLLKSWSCCTTTWGLDPRDWRGVGVWLLTFPAIAAFHFEPESIHNCYLWLSVASSYCAVCCWAGSLSGLMQTPLGTERGSSRHSWNIPHRMASVII